MQKLVDLVRLSALMVLGCANPGKAPAPPQPAPPAAPVAPAQSAAPDALRLPEPPPIQRHEMTQPRVGPRPNPDLAVRDKPLDGHARMVALLADIAEEPNSYFDTADVLLMQTQLKALTVPLAKMRVLIQLGWNKLRLGRYRAAIADLDAAREEVKKLPPVKQYVDLYVDFALAAALLRLSATDNCLATGDIEPCIMRLAGGPHPKPEAARKAAEVLERVVRHNHADLPRRVAAGWLLNLVQMSLGGYPEKVSKDFRIAATAFPSPPFKRFTDIAPGLGIDRVSLSGGAVVDDFDGDDDLDIITSSWNPSMRLGMWRNNGNGTFTEQGVQAGFEGITGGLNLIHADYDNDGDLDLFVLRGAWLAMGGQHPNSLLRNNGRGYFTDVTFDAGLGAKRYPTQTADFADYDHDGDLDLYIGNESLSRDGWPNELFRNNGDGTFTDVAAAAGVEDQRWTKGVAWGDYDGDGWEDIYLSNAGAPNRLYRNKRDGTFEDVAARAGVESPRVGFPTWWWDYDNDGRLDLMAFNGYAPQGQDPPVWNVAASYMGIKHNGELSRLYRNLGKGRFEDATERAGFRAHTLTMGSNFGDFDNDGWLDAYLGTGYPEYEGLMPNVALRNVEGRFEDVSFSSGLANLQKGHGVAFADFDRDGDQDIFEQMGGAFPGDVMGNALYENPGFGNHWLVVQAVGVRSNRDALGTRIKVVTREPGGGRRTIYRHVDTGSSFGGNPLRQHIGLGKAARVERLELYWPRTGKTQVFRGVEVDQALRIREDAKTVERRPYRRVPFLKHPRRK